MQRPEVPLRTKGLYGIGDVGFAAKNTSLNQFLLLFFADVMRVLPAIVSAAIFGAKLRDAVTDPVMGHLADTTRSGGGADDLAPAGRPARPTCRAGPRALCRA